MPHATNIPGDTEPLWQIFVTENHPVKGRREIAVGPKMHRRYIEPTMEAISKRIAAGIEGKSRAPWSNPRLVQVTEAKFQTEGLFMRQERAHPLIGSYGL